MMWSKPYINISIYMYILNMENKLKSPKILIPTFITTAKSTESNYLVYYS